MCSEMEHPSKSPQCSPPMCTGATVGQQCMRVSRPMLGVASALLQAVRETAAVGRNVLRYLARGSLLDQGTVASRRAIISVASRVVSPCALRVTLAMSSPSPIPREIAHGTRTGCASRVSSHIVPMCQSWSRRLRRTIRAPQCPTPILTGLPHQQRARGVLSSHRGEKATAMR